jgi:hypothetical protein
LGGYRGRPLWLDLLEIFDELSNLGAKIDAFDVPHAIFGVLFFHVGG